MNEDQVDCPYCDEIITLCLDDGAYCKDGESEEVTCENCDKIFLANSSLSWFRYSQKADCLNGAAHDFFLICSPGKNFRICQVCNFKEYV